MKSPRERVLLSLCADNAVVGEDCWRTVGALAHTVAYDCEDPAPFKDTIREMAEDPNAPVQAVEYLGRTVVAAERQVCSNSDRP